MAILFGTTSTGTTLPVLVDQFGNLLAQGMPGAEGPPGPPGIGELPANPFEGALLGWENGELVWVDCTPPLPAGVLGPYTYNAAASTLTVPQIPTYSIGDSVFMSDAAGLQASQISSTSLISNVLANNNSGPITAEAFNWGNAQNAIKGNITTRATDAGGVAGTIEFSTSIKSVYKVEVYTRFYGNGTAKLFLNNNEIYSYFQVQDGTRWYTIYDGTEIAFDKYTQQLTSGGSDDFWAIKINDVFVDCNSNPGLLQNTIPGGSIVLSFPDTNNFDLFNVGDIVQDPYVITNIDITTAAISVNGGNWSGSNGTSTPGVPPSVGQTSVNRTMSGTGTVDSINGYDVILNNDNGEWIDNYFVAT